MCWCAAAPAPISPAGDISLGAWGQAGAPRHIPPHATAALCSHPRCRGEGFAASLSPGHFKTTTFNTCTTECKRLAGPSSLWQHRAAPRHPRARGNGTWEPAPALHGEKINAGARRSCQGGSLRAAARLSSSRQCRPRVSAVSCPLQVFRRKAPRSCFSRATRALRVLDGACGLIYCRLRSRCLGRAGPGRG